MYPNNRQLLISINDIKNAGILDKNIDETVALAAANRVQDRIIRDLLGSRLYESLISMIIDESIYTEENEKYKELLDGYIFYIMAYRIKGELALDLNEKVRNFGVGRTSDDRVYPNSFQDLQQVRREYYDIADGYIVDLASLLKCHCNCFPELREFHHWWEKRPGSPTHSYFYVPSNNCCI